MIKNECAEGNVTVAEYQTYVRDRYILLWPGSCCRELNIKCSDCVVADCSSGTNKEKMVICSPYGGRKFAQNVFAQKYIIEFLL